MMTMWLLRATRPRGREEDHAIEAWIELNTRVVGRKAGKQG
jgi:hypothetical protein